MPENPNNTPSTSVRDVVKDLNLLDEIYDKWSKQLSENLKLIELKINYLEGTSHYKDINKLRIMVADLKDDWDINNSIENTNEITNRFGLWEVLLKKWSFTKELNIKEWNFLYLYFKWNPVTDNNWNSIRLDHNTVSISNNVMFNREFNIIIDNKDWTVNNCAFDHKTNILIY
jgi:hypothetical protein